MSPLNIIVFSITNGGGIGDTAIYNMVENTTEYFIGQLMAGEISCPTGYTSDSTSTVPTTQPSIYCPWAYSPTSSSSSNNDNTLTIVLSVIVAIFVFAMGTAIVIYERRTKLMVI